MIKPDRHINIDISVVQIGTYVLQQLNKFYEISYDDLLKKVETNIGEDSRENYPYALNFLFLLGRIKYNQETDSFIYHEA